MSDIRPVSSQWKKQLAIVWTGQLFSLLTSAIVQFSIVWWITEKTKSATMLSISMIVSIVPMAIAGPFAGVLVDRLSRKLIMILSDGSIALATVVLAFALMLNADTLWPIFVVLAIRSFFSAFHWPAMSATIPLLVPQEQLTRVAGINQALQSVSQLAGPAIGAIALSVWSLPAIIMLDVIGAVCGITSLLFVKIPKTPPVASESAEKAPGGKKSFFKEMADGLIAIKKVRGAIPLIIIGTLFTVVYMPVGSLFPLVVLTHFNGTAWHNSIVEIAFSGGMLFGGLALGVWGGPSRKILLINFSLLLFGLVTTALGFLPASMFIVFVILTLVMGFSVPFYNGSLMALVQTKFEPGMLGRVFSLVNTLMSIASPIGLVFSGAAADNVGLMRWFMFSGFVIIALAIVSFCVPSIMHIEDSPTPGYQKT